MFWFVIFLFGWEVVVWVLVFVDDDFVVVFGDVVNGSLVEDVCDGGDEYDVRFVRGVWRKVGVLFCVGDDGFKSFEWVVEVDGLGIDDDYVGLLLERGEVMREFEVKVGCWGFICEVLDLGWGDGIKIMIVKGFLLMFLGVYRVIEVEDLGYVWCV